MEPTFRLLRVRGIPVGAHWTWVLAFGIVAWTLAASVFPSAYPGLDGRDHLLMALAAAVLLFASVVLHELAHAVVARREGMPVEGITLWLLGGVSDVGGRPRSPGQEFRVAASGPAVSLLLAAAFAYASAGGRRLDGPEAVHGMFGYVARLNLLVAAFNLIPALPLDGGRILRSWLWRRQRDLLAATRSGARAGQAFGATLVVVGILDIGSGAGLLGVGLAVVGVVLVRAASSELSDTRTRDRLTGLTAFDVMASDPGVVFGDTPVDRLVESPPVPVRSGYPVLAGGRLMGVVALATARSVPSGERAERRVADVMTPLDDIPMVDADAPVLDILDRLNGTNPIGQVVVVADGCVVGILDEADVAGALDSRESAVDGDGDGGGDGGRRKAGARAWLLVAGLCLVGGAALYRPPYAVVSPGPAVDVAADVSIDGVYVTAVNGRYLALTGDVRRTNVLGTLLALRRGHRIVPAGEMAYWAEGSLDAPHPGVARETRSLAAAAAARSQGLSVTVTGTGARVAAVRPGSPAAGVLRVGDVIVAADGEPLTQAGALTELVRRRPPGPGLRLSVERDGRTDEMVVRTANDFGVTLETRDLAVQLPFEVRFAGRAAGGPGAGLAYALAIADLLSADDVARGRTIAAVGTITADGTVGPVVGPVVGMEEKAKAAADAGAALLLAPPDGIDGRRPSELLPVGVENLDRALEALSTAG